MMIRKRVLGLIVALMVTVFSTMDAASVNWMTNYDDAVKQAQSSQKPLLLFFTGSDWCGWCKKLEQEALDTPEFASLAGNKFIFVKLDFPSKTKLPPKDEAQNKELQKKYNIRGFPTIVLLDPQQQQIGVTGYRPGGGREYANHLLQMAQDFSGYKQKVSTLNRKSGKELKELHEKAKEFHASDDVEVIAMAGLDSDEAPYFMLERLRELSAKGQGNFQEAIVLREQLLSRDPDNSKHIHYHLAVLEFENRYQDMKKGNRDIDSTLAPLVDYIQTFGSTDNENLWRLEMIVCQVLMDKSQYNKALFYAESSYKHAPSTLKPDIAQAIQDIKSEQKAR